VKAIDTITDLHLVGDDDFHRPSVLGGGHASLPSPFPTVFLHSVQKNAAPLQLLYPGCATIGSHSQLSGRCGGLPPWWVVPPPLLLPLLNHSQPGLGRQRGARMLQFLDVAGVRTFGLSNLHDTREQNICWISLHFYQSTNSWTTVFVRWYTQWSCRLEHL